MAAVQLDAAQKAVLDAIDTALAALFSGGAEQPPATVILSAMEGYDRAININGKDYRPSIRDGFRIALASLMTHTISYVAPSLGNSWSNLGGVATAGYAKNAVGEVVLKGVITADTMNTAAFTLPAGFRPTETRVFSAIAYNGAAYIPGRLDVLADGSVVPVNVGGASQWISLENVRFKSQQ